MLVFYKKDFVNKANNNLTAEKFTPCKSIITLYNLTNQ